MLENWVRSQAIEIVATIIKRLDRLQEMTIVPLAEHPLDEAPREELQAMMKQWVTNKQRELTLESLLVLQDFAEHSDAETLAALILRPAADPVAEEQAAAAELVDAVLDDDSDDDEAMHADPDSKGSLGRGGVVTLRVLRAFLKRQGYRPVKSSNGEQVWACGKSRVSVPHGNGDMAPGTLSRILKRVAQQLGCEIVVIQGNPVVFNGKVA